MNFGEKIRELRKIKKLSQAELATLIDSTPRTIRTYELEGKHPRHRETYYKLAEVFNVDPNYLLTEDREFTLKVSEIHGLTGARQAQQLVEQMSGLFAGGELSEKDIDGVMRAMQELYWKAKDDNKKYAPKKSKKNAQ